MNSESFFYLYLNLINLKAIDSFKSFNFLQSLDQSSKTNLLGKVEQQKPKGFELGTHFGGVRKSKVIRREKGAQPEATTFINIKFKAEPGQTKVRQANALLAFSGLRRTGESINYRIGAKVSGLFGLSTTTLAPNLFSQTLSKIKAITDFKKYIKQTFASAAKQSGQSLRSSPIISEANVQNREFTKVTYSKPPITQNQSMVYFALEPGKKKKIFSYAKVNLNISKAFVCSKLSNTTTGFNLRILGESFKQNLTAHLKNCYKNDTNNQSLIGGGFCTFESLGRQGHQLNLTTSAPLVDLFNSNKTKRPDLTGSLDWNTQSNLPFLGANYFSLKESEDDNLENRDSANFWFSSKEMANPPQRGSSAPQQLGEQSLRSSLKTKKQSIYRDFIVGSKLFGLSTPQKKQSCSASLTMALRAKTIKKVLFKVNLKEILQKNCPIPHLFFQSIERDNNLTARDCSTSASNVPSRKIFSALKLKKYAFLPSFSSRYKNPESISSIEETAVKSTAKTASLTLFYSASWFLESIRTELCSRNANIKRVLNQAFLLTQQPLRPALTLQLKPTLVAKHNLNSAHAKVQKSTNENDVIDEILQKKQKTQETVIPHLIKGLKITFSGRTGGKKGMAKTLTKTVGRVPLSTLREKVDFAKGTVQTKVGSLGVKVWICYN